MGLRVSLVCQASRWHCWRCQESDDVQVLKMNEEKSTREHPVILQLLLKNPTLALGVIKTHSPGPAQLTTKIKEKKRCIYLDSKTCLIQCQLYADSQPREFSPLVQTWLGTSTQSLVPILSQPYPAKGRGETSVMGLHFKWLRKPMASSLAKGGAKGNRKDKAGKHSYKQPGAQTCPWVTLGP